MADAPVIQIDAMLGRIGWSICQAARRSHVSRDRIMRWRRGGSEPPAAFMVWLTALGGLHTRLASPLSRDVPVASNRAPMDAYAVGRALMIIGWSERRLAEHMGYHRTEVRRMLESGGRLGSRSSRWLEMLENGHRDLPCPIGSAARSRRPAPPGRETVMVP